MPWVVERYVENVTACGKPPDVSGRSCRFKWAFAHGTAHGNGRVRLWKTQAAASPYSLTWEAVTPERAGGGVSR